MTQILARPAECLLPGHGFVEDGQAAGVGLGLGDASALHDGHGDIDELAEPEVFDAGVGVPGEGLGGARQRRTGGEHRPGVGHAPGHDAGADGGLDMIAHGDAQEGLAGLFHRRVAGGAGVDLGVCVEQVRVGRVGPEVRPLADP